ncbi:LacI family DNA-binding transcriptional regulator [Isoptericola sp. AK164]|uniref:LacI family DNA-binding transcriptional regulator n=1 Tax=Isoptericola sp. AK164 TaxID=3024246 RepID=UPI00325A5BFB
MSVRDVARHAGVSVGTVSNALNRPDSVSPDALARVRASIGELGYVRNEAARNLRSGVTASIGLIVVDSQVPFFQDVGRGAADEAADRGIALLYGSSAEDPARERMYLDLFEEHRVRGLLIAPVGDVSRRLHQLRERGIRSVLVDRFSGEEPVSSVSVDNVAGGRMAVEHLLATGRRRIAFVGGPLTLRQVTDRLAGARVAADESGLPVSVEVVATETTSVAAGVAAGERLLAREPADRPDAVFAANDLVALGLLQAIVGDGRLRVPEDVAIMGFDDISFAAAAAVPLSSMRQPSTTIGATALRILLEESEDPDTIPRQTVYQPELVVRRSTVASA